MAQIYYYEEETLPVWMTPIMEAAKINSMLYSEFVQYLDDNDLVATQAEVELLRLMFTKFDGTRADEDTIRELLSKIETSNLNVMDVATRSALLATAVTYCQGVLSTKATEFTTIAGTVYSVPNDIGNTHESP